MMPKQFVKNINIGAQMDHDFFQVKILSVSKQHTTTYAP